MSNNSEKIQHLENIRNDVRDEIKNRITQRDKYSIQQLISLGVITGVAFSRPELIYVLFIAPAVSLYYTMLLIYSYKIHDFSTKYLREVLEPELADLCDLNQKIELQNYYRNNKSKPGIRREFFIATMWIVVTSTLFYLWYIYYLDQSFVIVLFVLSIVFVTAAVFLTRDFKSNLKHTKKKSFQIDTVIHRIPQPRSCSERDNIRFGDKEETFSNDSTTNCPECFRDEH